MSHRLQILICLAAVTTVFAQTSQNAASAVGRVVDAETKQPISNALVMVHSAGVRTGYDLACATCYVDCGKRTTTNQDGEFTIGSLSNNLTFNLLVVANGYSVLQLKKVDPVKGSGTDAQLKKRTAPPDPLQTAKGKVVDSFGKPVRDALISQQGLLLEKGGRMFGGDDTWIDPIAVSNSEGEFEMAHKQRAKGMVLEITPRGMAPKLATLSTGGDRQIVAVRDGATVRGRLVAPDGKPVPNAQMVVSTHARMGGMLYRDVAIGTNENGEFVITNVPAGRVWDLFPRMDAMAAKGISAAPRLLETRDDGQEINMGDITMKPAHTLKGRIVLADGSPIPDGMRVSLAADRVNDRQVVKLPPDGSFEFRGLAPGVYILVPAVKDHQPKNPDEMIEVLIEGDRAGLSVTLYPKPAAKP